jgi:hypothetical protein
MNRFLPFVTAALLASATSASLAQTPAPGQAGDDPSMAQPKGSTQPAAQPAAPVKNPESTVGLAPSEQPINNLKPRVAGQVVPSSEETAAHNASIFEHDMQPTLTHTFNFTADQKRAIVAALAQEKSAESASGVALDEAMVVPPSVALKPVPEAIAQEMPWVRPYYYVKSENRIVLVNPLGKYVVAVIQ